MPCVYFVKSKDQIGLIKIGHCSHMQDRLINLQSGNGFELSLLYHLPCKDKKEAVALEKDLHETFSYCRRRGEWFTPSRPLRNAIAFMAAGNTWNEAKKLVKKDIKRKWNQQLAKERCRKLQLEGKL